MSREEQYPYQSPDEVKRYQAAFNKYAKNGQLALLDILDALKDAYLDDYNEDDVTDVLDVMNLSGPLNFKLFNDFICILKDPQTIRDAFQVLEKKEGIVPEETLRQSLFKYSDLTGKEIEDCLERANAATNGDLRYNDFVNYWLDQ